MDTALNEEICLSKTKEFLLAQRPFLNPLLLGVSGGPDSMALLHVFLQLQKEIGFSFHVAHVDHGWREESKKEALLLEKMLEKLSIPFFFTTLPPRTDHRNAEERARELRYNFFEELFEKKSYTALVLGHHLDDLAETVLKRFLEGAHFSSLKGMEKVSKRNAIMIWRPFLDVKKSELLSFLEKRDIPYFIDKTNRDERYLRARMRESLFPLLTQKFGKEILVNISHQSKRSSELESYLDKRVESFFQELQKGVFSSYLYLDRLKSADRIEIRHFLKKLFLENGIVLRRALLETFVDWVVEKRRASFSFAKKEFFVDETRLYICDKKELNSFSLFVEEGVFTRGHWKIAIEKVSLVSLNNNSWESFIKTGKVELFLEEGQYQLAFPKKGECFFSKKLFRFYSENRVPLFLRSFVPVIYEDSVIKGQFLCKNPHVNKPVWHIVLNLL